MVFEKASLVLRTERTETNRAAGVKDINSVIITLIVIDCNTGKVEIWCIPATEFIWHSAENLTPVREPKANIFDWILRLSVVVNTTNFGAKRAGRSVFYVAGAERPER